FVLYFLLQITNNARFLFLFFFFFQAVDGIRDFHVTGVQTCALPICGASHWRAAGLRRLRGRRLSHRSGAPPAVLGDPAGRGREEIGRASCRERVARAEVEMSLQKTQKTLGSEAMKKERITNNQR